MNLYLLKNVLHSRHKDKERGRQQERKKETEESALGGEVASGMKAQIRCVEEGMF